MRNSFLQTEDWMNFQESLGRAVFRYDKNNIKAFVVRHDGSLRQNYLYIPHGPLIDFNKLTGGFDNPVKEFTSWLKQLAKEQGSMFIKMEPLTDNIAEVFVKSGFRNVKKELQPQKTVFVNLEETLEDLLKSFHYKTRYNIKVAEREGVKFEIIPEDKFDEAWKLYQKTAKRQKFNTHSYSYYKKMLNFNFKDIQVFQAGAYAGKELSATGIFLINKDFGYYLHGASDFELGKFKGPYLLRWETLKYMKNKGVKFHDMWGINDKKWPGVTRFKLGWGGKVIERPGSFDLPMKKIWYNIYKINQKIKGN